MVNEETEYASVRVGVVDAKPVVWFLAVPVDDELR